MDVIGDTLDKHVMSKKFAIIGLVLMCLSHALPGQAQVAEEAVWIDVRTPAEYASGHLEQAILIPFDGIEAGVAALNLSKDTPIYVYCAVGGRAEKAKRSLEAQDYSQVTNVGSLENARKVYKEGQQSATD